MGELVSCTDHEALERVLGIQLHAAFGPGGREAPSGRIWSMLILHWCGGLSVVDDETHVQMAATLRH